MYQAKISVAHCCPPASALQVLGLQPCLTMPLPLLKHLLPLNEAAQGCPSCCPRLSQLRGPEALRASTQAAQSNIAVGDQGNPCVPPCLAPAHSHILHSSVLHPTLLRGLPLPIAPARPRAPTQASFGLLSPQHPAEWQVPRVAVGIAVLGLSNIKTQRPQAIRNTDFGRSS